MITRLPGRFARTCCGALLTAIALLIHDHRHGAALRTDEDIQLMLRYLVEDGETPGIVLGILESDGSTRILSYGSAGPDTRPLGPRSAFEIGSITKTFTATLLADRVERGEMSLTDPVSQYLPEGVTMPSRSGREITLLDLATHHSGLPRLPDNFAPADGANPYADYTVEQLYEFVSNHQLERDPGAEYEYSNVGVGLLGHVLELASGMTYEELVRERISGPLGMQTTSITLEGDLADWMTKGHNGSGEPVPYWDVTTLAGAGGLRSNVEDMLKYLAANIGSPESDIERAMRATHEVREQIPENDMAIGLNWHMRYEGERELISHGGGTAGFSTMIAFDPELGVGIVRLTNAGGFGDDIAMDFLRRGPPLAIPEIDVSEEVLASYVGEYEMGPGNMAVRLEDEGYLTMQAPGNVRFRMYAESDTKFFVKRTPWRFTFTKDEAANVIGVIADLEGRELRGQKVSDETPAPEVVAGNVVDDTPVRDLPLTAEDIARYEGTYTIEAGTRTLDIRVFGENGQLMAQPTGQSTTRLLHQGDHEFALAADNAIRLIFTVEDGRATAVTLHQGGGEFPGKRKP